MPVRGLCRAGRADEANARSALLYLRADGLARASAQRAVPFEWIGIAINGATPLRNSIHIRLTRGRNIPLASAPYCREASGFIRHC